MDGKLIKYDIMNYVIKDGAELNKEVVKQLLNELQQVIRENELLNSIIKVNDSTKYDYSKLKKENEALKAENEQLKKELWQLQHRKMWNKEATLQAELLIKENEELKKEIKSYKCQKKFPNQCHCAFKCLGNEFCQDADKKIDNYRKALEEIREYLQRCKKKKSNFYTLNDVVTDIANNIEKIISEVNQ